MLNLQKNSSILAKNDQNIAKNSSFYAILPLFIVILGQKGAEGYDIVWVIVGASMTY